MIDAVAPPAPTLADAREGLSRLRARRGWQFLALALLAAATLVAGVMVGSMRIAPADLLAWAGGSAAVDASTRTVIEQIRLPRVVMGFLVGAALAVAGAAMQGLFRNPLADPGLIGISAGAALGAVGVIVLGAAWLPALPAWVAPYLLAVAAFGGSFVATAIIYQLSLHDGRPVVATMLLAGVAVNALAGALTAFLIFLADDQQVRDVTFWLLGSLGAATWLKTGIVAVVVLPGVFLLPSAARALNALLLGEAEAGHLGFDVARTKAFVVIATTIMIGTAVAFTGVIGFVGLIVPHALRLAGGADHRFLLPGSALLGGTLVVAADLVARTAVAPAELPIGILTAILGAPFFLWLLVRAKGAWQP